TEIGSAEVDADGNWEITPSTPLDDGGHILSVSATDPAGNEGDRSDIFLLTVDASAPDAPSLDDITVYDDEPEITGDLDSGDVTDDVQPTISGTGGTEGDTVTLYVGTDVVATTIVGADGSWAFSPDPTFNDGDTVEMTFTYTDEAGNESAPSDPFALTFDSTAPDAPDAGDITVTDDVAPLTGELADGDETDDTQPTFSGINGTPGETVTVYSGSTAIGTAVVGEDGTWSLDPETELDEGAHDFTVTYTDEAGNESAPTDLMSLTVDTTSPDFPSSSTLIVLDNVGDAQGPLSSGDLTDDDALTVSGTGGTEGETVTLYVDGVAVATTLVGAGGTWSFADDVELEDGDHVLAYTFSDAAGNESDPSPDFELTVDTVAPDAPDASEITVTDDVDPITGTLEDGDDTNDTLP
ncbi:Ig-like domain-containing protein, partial [Tritonibacter mobilis]|uniref:Ig-like domain-containing protein n=1 Tax=Tritonibacter mobilis TaxID=379347 RepID=UPI001D0DB0F7